MVEQMTRIANSVKPGVTVIITPMPRFLDPCCAKHGANKTEDLLEEERSRLLKAVWDLKRETYQLVAKSHCRNVIVCSPMEVLGLRGSVEGVRNVMGDGVHLDERALDALMDSVILKAEESLVARKRGPTERAGPVEKRPRFTSDRGSRGGRGGWRGGRGRGGWRGSRSHSDF
jgi:hypothetical protein